jgi:hypothetical protein
MTKLTAKQKTKRREATAKHKAEKKQRQKTKLEVADLGQLKKNREGADVPLFAPTKK